MIKYCGAAICALTAIIVLRGQRSEFAGIVALAASTLLFGAAAVELYPLIKMLGEMLEGTSFEGYLEALVKALGITLAVQFSSELCRDAGESAIASKLELVGKAELILLCIPLIKELLTLASVFLE